MENFTRQTGGRPLRAVEFGALYGNSTLAYKYGMDWDKTVAVWRDPKAPLTPRFNVHVTASDISVPALEYGLKRGIYDAVHAHDFNKVLPRDLTDAVMDADVMFCLMSTNYLKLIQWQRMCLQFLGDRSKPKLLCWNVVCAFDQRNLTPEVLFSALKNWTATSHFIKHRNFSDEERAAHGGCRESWTMMYVVRFEAENAQI